MGQSRNTWTHTHTLSSVLPKDAGGRGTENVGNCFSETCLSVEGTWEVLEYQSAAARSHRCVLIRPSPHSTFLSPILSFPGPPSIFPLMSKIIVRANAKTLFAQISFSVLLDVLRKLEN